MQSRRIERPLVNNLLWLIGSLALAIVVWYLALNINNPFTSQTFPNIPVEIIGDENVFIVAERETVLVVASAPGRVFDEFDPEEVSVVVDLRGREPGEYTETVVAELPDNIRAITTVNPQRIRFTIEPLVTQKKMIEVVVANEPPTGYSRNQPDYTAVQADVSGSKTLVDSVVSVQAEVDLSDELNPINEAVRLVAIDTNGDVIEDVDITPQSVTVSVDVFQRDDLREVTVSPNLNFSSLALGYVIESIQIQPETIFVSGPPGDLAEIGSTISTEQIDLSNRLNDFEITVPIELPNSQLLVYNNDRQVTVSVGIGATQSSQQVDDIAVTLIGVPDDKEVEFTPDTVSVVISGPIGVVESIAADDVTAIIDLAGLEDGNHDVEPVITISDGQVSEENITSILPANINVVINSPELPAEATPDVTPTTEDASADS